MRRDKNKVVEYYAVLNQDGEAFAGMKAGEFQYTADWTKAKTLPLSNTQMLMAERGNELIKESEL
jgi:hypothetical protein|tara:strand:- start:73 stop:267 length:195 start_codon:yes stop_codon:yes gene_type:complete